MPGQEVLYHGKGVIVYRSLRDGIAELEKFTGLSPYECKYSTIIRANEAEGKVEVRFVEWTCNAGADGYAIEDAKLARDVAETIRNMKPGYQNVVETFNDLIDLVKTAVERRDEEVKKAMEELIDTMEELRLKHEILEFLRKARTDEEVKKELLQLIEEYIDDP